MIQPNHLQRAGKGFLVFILIVVLLAGALALWLRYAPQHFEPLAASVLKALQAEDAPYELRASRVSLGWESWSDPLAVQLENIRFVSAEHDSELTIPSGTAEVAFWPLLRGRLRVEALTLRRARLQIERREAVWALLNEAGDVVYRHLPGEAGRSGAPPLPVAHVVLEEARLSLRDAVRGMQVQSHDTRLDVRRQADGALALAYAGEAALGEHRFALQLEGRLAPGDAASSELAVKLRGFNPFWLCETVIRCTDTLPVLDMPLSGSLALRGAGQWPPESVAFSLDGRDGRLDATPWLAEELPLRSLALQGRLGDSLTTLELANAAFDFNGTTLQLHGDAAQETDGWRITADGDATQMPVEDLYKYWPPSLAPQTRRWATTRITQGMATSASASVRLLPGDLTQATLPDGFLQAQVHVQGATLDYLPGFPAATQVDAEVLFTGQTMRAEIAHAGAMSGTVITGGTLRLPDLNANGTPVEAELRLKAPLQDALAFRRLLPGEKLKDLPVDASRANGTLEAELSLAFNAFGDDGGGGTGTGKSVNWDRLDYDVEATLKQAGNLTLFHGITLDTLSGRFKADEQTQHIELNGKSGAQPYSLRYDKQAGRAAALSFTGRVNTQLISRLMPELATYVSGRPRLSLQAAYAGGTLRDVRLKADLGEAELRLRDIHYHKPRGQPASLSLDPAQDGAYSWHYDAAGLKAGGTLRYDAAAGTLSALSLRRLESDGQDIALDYRRLADGYRVALSGRRLDLSPFWKPEADTPFSLSDFPPVRLDVDLAELRFPGGKAMRQVQGHLHCSSTRCESADLSAQLPADGRVSLHIGREGGTRHFSLQATQTGELLRLLHIHDRLYGGTADITGSYDDSAPHRPLSGRAIVTDFVIRDAPILGRIFNASSLPGLLDSLTGAGIRFEKFAGDFTFADDLLRLREAKASGPSLGILISGDLNLRTDMLDISGNLAPAYVINSLLGKIPLIGEALVGGEGESIFAVNYSVKGDMDNPTITTNPLSALTPGFTRRFFDIFDAPPDTSLPDRPDTSDAAPIWQGEGPDTRVPDVQTNELAPPVRQD